MIEPEPQNKHRIPTNTVITFASILMTGFSIVMKQNGYLQDQIYRNKVIAAGVGFLAFITSLGKFYYEDKYEYVQTDPKRTERVFKEAIREGLIGFTAIVIQDII